MKDITIEKAKRLRREMTEPEKLLWSHLRARQLGGYKFRRQHPMPPYIVDFCCIEKRLVIELDGIEHQNHQDYDEARSLYFATKGYEVLRFWNNDVYQNVRFVLGIIKQKLETSI